VTHSTPSCVLTHLMKRSSMRVTSGEKENESEIQSRGEGAEYHRRERKGSTSAPIRLDLLRRTHEDARSHPDGS
jgi:DNA-nicking Smr family endonuclease